MYQQIKLIFNYISDSKRQQMITVDYKRLLSAFFLTDVVTLQRQNNKTPTSLNTINTHITNN